MLGALQDAALESGAPGALEVTALAVVQGLTEFLPVSSSGHLVLAEEALGLEAGGLLLPVALHVGTLLAVLAVYRGAVAELLVELARGRPRGLLTVLLASVPAGVAGIAFGPWFEARFAEPRTVGYGLLATALVLFAADRFSARAATRGSASSRAPSVLDALLVGFAQALAILPGVSRSGATIGVGLLRGLSPAQAARFSFLMSLVAVGGAALLEARELLDGADPEAPSAGLLVWGVVASAATGWVALKLLLAFLERGAFRWFALYCLALGAGVLALV